MKEIGREISREIGVWYNGPWEGYHLLTDPITGSSFMATCLTEAEQKLKVMRENFKLSTSKEN